MKKLMTLAAILFAVVISFSLTNSNTKTILIDVAHGGDDSGAKVEGYSEKDIALQIASKIQELGQKNDIKIILTRKGDRFMTHEEKVELIKNVQPNLILSLHANHAPTEMLSGMEIYHSKDEKVAESSIPFADKLQKYATEMNHKAMIKAANFPVFKLAPTTPTLLIEMGFLSNPDDLKLLASEEGQTKIATLILKAIH